MADRDLLISPRSCVVCAGVKREEDLKVREKTLQNLRIKGAFTAQELYEGHRGQIFTLRFCLIHGSKKIFFVQ